MKNYNSTNVLNTKFEDLNANEQQQIKVAKPIPGYDGKYLITETGHIWNNILKRFITERPDKNGYLTVRLIYKGVNKFCRVSRLMAITYLPNPENKNTVDHIDHNRQNNNLSNLRWFTSAENNKNRNIGTNTVKEAAKKRSQVRQCLVHRLEDDTYYDSETTACRAIGLRSGKALQDYFSDDPKCKRNHIRGYHFELVNKSEFYARNQEGSKEVITKKIIQERQERNQSEIL